MSQSLRKIDRARDEQQLIALPQASLRARQALGVLKPVARVLTSSDGGPVRRIVNGRQTKYTGFFVAVKGGFFQMPWESRHAEKPAIILSEASSRVVSLMAQPHRLEMNVQEQKAPLVYFPDLMLKVHRSFLEDLKAGVPFSTAALAPSENELDDTARTLIIEIKDDLDRRQSQPRYRRKMELASTVYERLGIDFLTIHRGEDIFLGDLRIASRIVAWRHTAVSQLDVWTVEKVLRRADRTAGDVVAALGGGPKAWGKLRALHVRRIVEIDITEEVSPDSVVWLPTNNQQKISVKS